MTVYNEEVSTFVPCWWFGSGAGGGSPHARRGRGGRCWPGQRVAPAAAMGTPSVPGSDARLKPPQAPL